MAVTAHEGRKSLLVNRNVAMEVAVQNHEMLLTATTVKPTKAAVPATAIAQEPNQLAHCPKTLS